MHLTSVVDELTFVVKTLLSEPGDFLKGFANTESLG
jgi:hypothetical protein